MPFGNKAKPTRAYAYHAKLVSGGDAIHAELRRRQQLWNKLVDLDRDLRERRDAILDEWRGLTAEQHTERRDEIAALRRASHQEPTLRRRVEQMEYEDRQARKPGYKDESVKAKLAELEEEAYEQSKSALYEDDFCWWPNSNAVRASWQQARRGAFPLRYHALRDEDKLDIQLIGGRSVDELVNGEWKARGFVQMLEWDPTIRQKHAVTPVRLRIGGKRNEPEWADLLVCFHRPLPEGGRVQAIQLVKRRIADQTYWTIIFIVAIPEVDVPAPSSHTVWLDIGWRRVPDGLRIAVWRNDQGDTGEIILDKRWLAARAKVDDLQSIRDDHFNAIRARLSDWLRTNDAPDWLREECRTLVQWRSPGRLASLTMRWKEQRFGGDDSIFETITAWWRRDRHLWQWQLHQLDQCIGQRRDIYRTFAAHLAHIYGTVVLEEADWAKLARKPKRGTPATDPETTQDRAIEDVARRHRHWAAVSTLELALENAVKREGGSMKRAASPYTTALCAHCGSCERWDHVELTHTCSQCGVAWDQDKNTVHLLSSLKKAAPLSTLTT